MLTDKARVMTLLNEAARKSKKEEALRILFEHRNGGVADWAAARIALQKLLDTTARGAP